MDHQYSGETGYNVALLAEGGDRNDLLNTASAFLTSVALLAEGGDRNGKDGDVAHHTLVALLAEGGDRNEEHGYVIGVCCMSPSSRRVGIEISKLLVNMLPL